MNLPIPESAARDALAALAEAIDIPNGVTAGDQEIRDKILLERVGDAVVMLRGILRERGTVDVPWSVEYLRARLAEHPAVGYRTWADAVAETAKAARR